MPSRIDQRFLPALPSSPIGDFLRRTGLGCANHWDPAVYDDARQCRWRGRERVWIFAQGHILPHALVADPSKAYQRTKTSLLSKCQKASRSMSIELQFPTGYDGATLFPSTIGARCISTSRTETLSVFLDAIFMWRRVRLR
jgi:hypothetical protein